MPDAENLGLKSHSEPVLTDQVTSGDGTSLAALPEEDERDPSPPSGTSTPASTDLSRSGSLSGYDDNSSSGTDTPPLPPIDRLTAFDILENLALPARLEKLSQNLSLHTERAKRQQRRLRSAGRSAKERLTVEWQRQRKQLLSPGGTAEEQLERYRRRVRTGVEQFAERWGGPDGPVTVTTREKASFVFGVLNIVISAYMVGAWPEWFHVWYTVQLLYYMPIRYYTYHKKGYHYFLADLCYFVNFLLLISLWIFPNSKRLFITTFSLAFGNNAIAIALWRNSLVFHSLDKVTSLFIHLMPCITLHCIIHLLPAELQESRFPAIHFIKYSPRSDPDRWTARAMMVWSTVPYLVWQLSYHFLITVRRREKIRAGRPTSFTWLKRSYAPTWIGRVVLSLPNWAQETAFMALQYSYAILTILPCPFWFRSRLASALFLAFVFTWSVRNGATYYIDVFGNRFQSELEALKKDMAKWQQSPELRPGGDDVGNEGGGGGRKADILPSGVATGAAGTAAREIGGESDSGSAGTNARTSKAASSGDADGSYAGSGDKKRSSIEAIPPLNSQTEASTGECK